MDSLPTELVKLCRLASMAECGDYFWESVPALGLWATVWMSVTGRWGGWSAMTGDILHNGPPENMQAGV